MMDLSKEALALLESAKMADSAPSDARRRVGQRLVGAVAAGTVSTSALLAKGASLGGSGAATGTTASVAASASLTTTLVSAVLTGLSLGLVSLAPTSTAPEQPPVATKAVRAAPAAAPVAPTPLRNRAAGIASSAISPLEPEVSETAAQPVNSGTLARTQAPLGASAASRNAGPSGVGVAATDIAPSVVDLAPIATAPLDVSVPQQPSKASIARETDLLAQVQRALQQGRPATALARLNRYDAEFPSGTLHEESIASRVMALCAFGRAKDAERWSAEFFRRYPNSPLCARVRGACRAAGQPGLEGRDRSE